MPGCLLPLLLLSVILGKFDENLGTYFWDYIGIMSKNSKIFKDFFSLMMILIRPWLAPSLQSWDIKWTGWLKIHLVKAMVFPVVMYECENWTIKKTEHWRIDAFELWFWRRLLRVPWTARRSNQSILKEISPGCSLEGLRLKLKLQYFGNLMQRADSFEKTLKLGKIEGRRRRGQQRMRRLDSITNSMDMSFG